MVFIYPRYSYHPSHPREVRIYSHICNFSCIYTEHYFLIRSKYFRICTKSLFCKICYPICSSHIVRYCSTKYHKFIHSSYNQNKIYRIEVFKMISPHNGKENESFLIIKMPFKKSSLFRRELQFCISEKFR